MERQLFGQGVSSPKGRRALTLPVSIAVHAAVVATALVLPLLSENTLPDVAAAGPRVFFSEPVPLAPALPPPGRQIKTVKSQTTARPQPMTPSTIVAPREIPDTILDDPQGAGIANGGDPNGVDGGVPWGVPGAIIGGLPPAAAPVTGPVRVGGKILAPRKIRNANPVYPELARRVGLQGEVELECTIDPQGRVVNARVVRGITLLDNAAREAVLQWAYTPTLLNGVPVPVLLNVTVVFSLR